MKKLSIFVFTLGALYSSWAASTINDSNRFSYGANVGWTDWRPNSANGAVLGEYVCAGYIYAANVGWVNLGGGSPANGIRYQNNSATDFGVNHNGLGNLRGYAYGANIGWVNFESQGAPRIDLKTGNLSGYIYSANVGWISLSNAVAFVQTDTIQPGADRDGDGIADAWELTHAGNLTQFSHTSDSDADGISDFEEYLADTDPFDPLSGLRITGFIPSASQTTLSWTSVSTRVYRIEEQTDITSRPLGQDVGLGLIYPDGANTTIRTFTSTPSQRRFFIIRAVKPLSLP